MLLPALVLLMGLVALGALYAGFAAARAVGAGSLATRRGLGRDHRPGVGDRDGARSWSLAGGLFHGDADDASVFGVFLLGGALAAARAGGAPARLRSDRKTASQAPLGLGERLLGVAISFWISRTCCWMLLLDTTVGTLHRQALGGTRGGNAR